MKRKSWIFFLVASSIFLLTTVSFADSLKLKGKKVIEGEIFSVSESHIGFKNEVYGYFPWANVEWVKTSNENFEEKIQKFAPGKLKSPSLEELGIKKAEDKLTSGDWQERKKAVVELSKSKDPTIFNKLCEKLKTEKNKEVKLTIIKAFGDIGNKSAVPILVKYLKEDPNPEFREASARSLGKLKDDSAFYELQDRLLKDADEDVKIAIIWALGEMKDRRAIPLLLKFLDLDKYRYGSSFQVEVIRALGKIEPENNDVVFSVSKILTHPRFGYSTVAKECISLLGEAARRNNDLAADFLIKAVKKYLNNPRSLSSYRAGLIISELGKNKEKKAIPLLIDAISERSLSDKAATALIEINDQSVTPHLIEILKKAEDRDIRKNIIEVLGALKDRRARKILTKIAIEDPDSYIRAVAQKALSKIED